MITQKSSFVFVLILALGTTCIHAQDTKNDDTFPFATQKGTAPSSGCNPKYSDWLHYDDGMYYTNLAYTPEEIPFSLAVAFPPALLQSYEGHVLTTVALFENEWNTGDLLLSVYYGNSYMPLTLVSQQMVHPLCEWWFHEIELEHPVDIDTSKHLWIVFSEITVTETFSAVCSENLIDADPNARWVQFEENKWMDVGDFGFADIQFMIRGYVTDPWGIEVPLTDDVLNVYPNPGKGVLNIRTALENAFVEVYDLNGRLIHSQALTEPLTAIDAVDWAEGVYVWKTYTTDVSTGSTSLVETGKWVKE